MKIGIIGAGQIGGTLTRRLSALGHDVSVLAQQPGTPVYGTDLDADSVRRALSHASRERTSQWRASPGSKATMGATARRN